MKNEGTIKNIIFIVPLLLLMYSCSQKSNIIDIDLSNLPKQKKINSIEKNKKELKNTLNKAIIKDLIPYKNKDKLLSQFKFGKEDPFSESKFKVTKLYSNLKLTGFLNTEKEKYVFVNYLGNAGAISGDSIGGLNTNLLPNGAKVIYIDNNEKQLKINFNNESYIFEF